MNTFLPGFSQQRLGGVALVATLALTGCASTPDSKVRVDTADSGAPSCQTFEWISTSQPTTLTEQHVKSEVFAKLKEKGYQVNDSTASTSTSSDPNSKPAASQPKADCKITYALDGRDRDRPRGGSRSSIGVGAGGGSGGIGGGIGVRLPIGGRRGEPGDGDGGGGTFTIDVIDVNRNAQVWSGSTDSGFRKPEPTADEVRKVVGKVMERYPNHP